MAIEIIKQGKTKFTAICYKCDCEFTYETEDVVGSMIMCPCCGNHITHVGSVRNIKYPYDAISCNNPMSAKKCEECDFYRKYLVGGENYVGDSPCQWCMNSPYRITCNGTTSVIKTK